MLARLAGALRDEPSRARRDELSREAVGLARRGGDDAVLAYALDGRAIAILAPDTCSEVLELASELLEAAERIGDRERVVHAHMHRLGPLLMQGRVDEARTDLDAGNLVAQELRQPGHLWDVSAAQAMLALAAGRLGEAGELIELTLAHGERAHPEMVIPVYLTQRYTLWDFRGNVDEVQPAIRDLVAERPARPVFRCVLAHVHARMGRLAQAQRALDDLTRDDCSALPFDQEWMFGMSLLAETAQLVEDPGAAAVLYPLLRPWSALNVVDPTEGIRGSASRYLGILATTTERWDEAAPHFDDAIAMNDRMGARPWLAHTQEDYARMLLARARPEDREHARGLLDDALATYRELGVRPRHADSDGG